MLRSLKDLFDTLTAPSAGQPPAQRVHQEHLATAVLLVEVMRADPRIGAAERDAVLAALRHKFALADDELQRLVELAEQESQGLYDFHRFTSALNAGFSHAQKIAVVESMWEVAYADAQLDVHESHLIGKIAGLLHVTHGEHIAAKMHARETVERARG